MQMFKLLIKILRQRKKATSVCTSAAGSQPGAGQSIKMQMKDTGKREKKQKRQAYYCKLHAGCSSKM